MVADLVMRLAPTRVPTAPKAAWERLRPPRIGARDWRRAEDDAGNGATDGPNGRTSRSGDWG